MHFEFHRTVLKARYSGELNCGCGLLWIRVTLSLFELPQSLVGEAAR